MAKAIRLEDGKRFQMGKGDSRHLVDPDMGANQLTMNYSIFQPGHEFPQHFHDISADIFIVLEGGVSVRQGDSYIPITVGDFAYIPPGEVHGTINQTDDTAILISFQSPPDPALYRGERDPAITGSVPTPPPGHVSKVYINRLTSGTQQNGNSTQSWQPVSPATGATEMVLTLYELQPGSTIAPANETGGEGVWFVWAGQATLTAGGQDHALAQHNVAFISPGESQQFTNNGDTITRLIHCLAAPG